MIGPSMILQIACLFALGCTALGAVASVARVIWGPSLADRVVGADLFVMCLVVALGINAARTGDTTYLDVLVVVALLGFVSTSVMARFIEQRGV